MQTSKQVTIRLFYNLSDRSFYVQIGKEMLFRVSDKTVTAIQAKENIEIVHAKDIKDMQRLANDEN
jgi:hypothetical protein